MAELSKVEKERIKQKIKKDLEERRIKLEKIKESVNQHKTEKEMLSEIMRFLKELNQNYFSQFKEILSIIIYSLKELNQKIESTDKKIAMTNEKIENIIKAIEGKPVKSFDTYPVFDGQRETKKVQKEMKDWGMKTKDY